MKQAIILDRVEYCHHEQKILQSIDLGILEGDFVIVIGPNGSGKSSLLKLINGTLKPTSGHIIIDQQNIAGWPVHAIAHKVATLTQDLHHSTFSELTVEMNLDLALSRAETKQSIKSREKADYLASFNKTLKERLKTPVEKLSGGQRQALALAMCFAHTPKVLLLDEHTSALDPKAASALMELTHIHVKEKNLTTLMVTHSLDQAMQFGNRLIALNEGKIIADLRDSDKTALTKNQLISLAY